MSPSSCRICSGATPPSQHATPALASPPYQLHDALCPPAPRAPPRRRSRSPSSSHLHLSSHRSRPYPSPAPSSHADRPCKKIKKSPAVAAFAVFTSLAFAEAGSPPPAPAVSSCGSLSKLGEAFQGNSEGRGSMGRGFGSLSFEDEEADLSSPELPESPDTETEDLAEPEPHPSSAHRERETRSPRRSAIVGRQLVGLGLDLGVDLHGRMAMGLGLGLQHDAEDDDRHATWEEPPPPYYAP